MLAPRSMKLQFDARPLPSPGRAEVCGQEVEIWLVDLDLVRDPAGRDLSILSADEIARADLMAPAPRRRMVASRCFLRRVLAAYLGGKARQIAFSYGPQGKPGLAGTHSRSGLHFNMSHTANSAIVAVGHARLGVDLEARRALRDPAALARRFFAPSEARALCAVPPSDQSRAVLRFWTRKEAYAKAVGGGIATGLRSFELQAVPGLATALLGPDGLPDPDWTLRDLFPRHGLLGSLAVNQPDCARLCWRAEPPGGRRAQS